MRAIRLALILIACAAIFAGMQIRGLEGVIVILAAMMLAMVAKG